MKVNLRMWRLQSEDDKKMKATQLTKDTSKLKMTSNMNTNSDDPKKEDGLQNEEKPKNEENPDLKNEAPKNKDYPKIERVCPLAANTHINILFTPSLKKWMPHLANTFRCTIPFVVYF